MSGEKHIFKIVPGESFSDTNDIPIFEQFQQSSYGTGQKKYSEYNLAKVNFEALDDESEIELSLPLQMCQFEGGIVPYNVKTFTVEMLCLKEDGKKLNLCTIKQERSVDNNFNDDRNYYRVELDEVLSLVKGKSYKLSIFDKESGECLIKSRIKTDSSFDFESAKKSLNGTNNFFIAFNIADDEMRVLYPKFEVRPGIIQYPFISVCDQAKNVIASIPCLSLAYFNGRLVSIKPASLEGSSCILIEPVEYQYITLENSGDDYQIYLSDYQGNMIDRDSEEPTISLLHSVVLNKSISYNDYSNLKEIILSNGLEEMMSSNTFTKIFAQGLTSNQLKTLANTFNNEQLQKIIPELSSNQLQALAENLTDNQFLALVDHLTNHQLQALTHTLDSKKLGIIVPLLNKDQVANLVKDFNLDQVKEIFPHLKMDQFQEVINTMSNDQFVELIKDADEKAFNTLLHEALKDRLSTLVKMLEGDKLHNLINKLDHEKLAIVARELTDDSDKIQMVVKSLANNPEKLKAFAHSMSHEQFKELLDNVDVKDLKDIIHKLPHEKVISVIGDLGSKDQSSAIIDALKEKFNEQNEKMKDLMSKVERMLPEESEANWNDAHPSTYVLQDVNAEFAVTDHLL
ncbi:magnesium transporter MgtE N-terminal domain-containing protein [Wolbachia endosymbiont (group B) of Villa cingulata]|uniref:magnesium transporter MgtE N-terminal domain-containing protein n=2 Tax=unclassified Wolbachia TaxID=2640676 RepID=UPI003342608B